MGEDLFHQTPPRLGNQYLEDRVLRSYLERALPEEVLRQVEPELLEMGELAGGELYHLQLADRRNEPVLTRWDAWGERVDRVEVTPLWRRARELAARFGLVAAAYERRHGPFSRLHQFALVYLFTPSTDIYSCPLAMTDGAAATLLAADGRELAARAVPRLTSRDPERLWTSGQWMTESTGGSDVGRSQTVARREGDGWRLHGRKWFTSAAEGEMALTLARPEGNPPGGRGLALFYVETRDPAGRPTAGLRITRLKDKLGTRKVPTAELILDGTPARAVGPARDGVRAIAPMLNLTRTWNGVSAVALMRRGLALARSYAAVRVAFGATLAEKPLHLDTLAGLQAELEAAFHLTFRAVALLGRVEAGEGGEDEAALLRLLVPIVKLTTARQAVAVASEVLEAFGGAGYVEDTGLPVLLRDSQVLPIWEGTTNVLALDVLRVLGTGRGLAPLAEEVARALAAVRDPGLAAAAGTAREALARAAAWYEAAAGRDALEAGARRLALTLGRALALALLADHAQWSLAREGDARAAAAARRFAQAGVDLMAAPAGEESRALANDLPLPLALAAALDPEP